MKITVETFVNAPVAKAWSAYTTPAEIVKWNTGSDDWHTTRSTVDLRAGGAFSSRMEAKDGSFGFDFSGTYTTIIPDKRIEYSFGDRTGIVEFVTHPEEQQRRRLASHPEQLRQTRRSEPVKRDAEDQR